jgi:hypothetical protein
MPTESQACHNMLGLRMEDSSNDDKHLCARPDALAWALPVVRVLTWVKWKCGSGNLPVLVYPVIASDGLAKYSNAARMMIKPIVTPRVIKPL